MKNRILQLDGAGKHRMGRRDKKRWNIRRLAGIMGAVMLAVSLTGCAGTGESTGGAGTEAAGETESENGGNERSASNKVAKAEVSESLRDKATLYENRDPASVKTMYLTVSSGNSSENTDHTWKEINSYSVYDYEDMGVERYQVEGIVQEGDENGPTEDGFGYYSETPNATVQVRGQTSSRQAQKNYKIEIKKNKGTIEGQRTINLNKHVSDGLRFRNKLCFDLLSEIPQLLSLRTQFVHLYVKDETASGTSGAFEDYGLYTQVEQLNKTGLKNHGLDSQGHLYKINYFEFFRYEDVIKLQTDADYDEKKFSELLECKGNNDNTKLIQMLDALNDYSIPIGTILDTYFDRENIAYWMAFQILVGNVDTNARNVYLYSPLNSSRWYLIPWDHDVSFMYDEYNLYEYSEAAGWQMGISNYWGNVLFNRCLKEEDFCSLLNAAVEDVKGYLSSEHLSELVEKYRSVTEAYVYSLPDRTFEGLTQAQYDRVADGLPELVELYYQRYLDSLEKPMPFFIGVPQTEDGKMVYNWDPAYDFDFEDITYHVELSDDYTFSRKLLDQDGIRVNRAETDILEPGQYFLRITAKNESGQEQTAFDYYITDAGKQYGMLCFYVGEDGEIRRDEYEEG
ncbi:MAG: CotH kinase family protein [Lachnospiraceae bacterium]|nr:CotH kinase family protein [Lachnospiraceae bacterium]MDD3794664.1 CotH kinase family protein [Lachnospiraceae bacterium]